MSDVFISYSRKDIAFARVLYDALRARNLDIWVDWEDIPPSADWLAEVYQAIEAANTLVFVVSQASVQSDICRREIEHGLKNRKRIVPVLLDDLRPGDLPPGIAALNWIFFRQVDDFQQSFDKLLRAIQTDLDWVRIHTRLLVRAKEWEGKGRDSSFLLRGRELQEAETWLSQAKGKDATPTDLQVEYALASRTAATRRQRITLGIVTAGLLVALLLALLAWRQRNEAVTARGVAVAEAQMRATAEMQALEQRDRAEKQRQVALSRQLAAQARLHLADQLDLALLLGVVASNITETVEARSSLLEALQYSPQLSAFLHGHTSYVFSVAFHPRTHMLASASADGSVVLWDADRPDSGGQRLAGHSGQVTGVAFSPDGSLLASSSYDRSVILWNVATGQPALPPLVGHKAIVHSVAFSPDGRTLASGGSDQSVILWDVATGQPLGEPLGPHWGNVQCVRFSPDGKTMAVGAYRTIVLWDVTRREPVSPRLEGHRHYVTHLAFSGDGRALFSAGDEDDAVMVWDVQSAQLRDSIPLPQGVSGAFGLSLSPDGSMLAIGMEGGRVALWRVESRQIAAILLTGQSLSVPGLSFSADGEMLAAGTGQRVILWSLQGAAQRLERQFANSKEYTGALAIHPDGRTLALARRDYSIILWDITSGSPVGQPLQGHTAFVIDLAFSSDGRLLASASEDKTVIVWEVATHRMVGQPLAGHSKSVRGVAFSPDGRTLASCGADSNVILWDVATGQQLLSALTGHSGQVQDVAFSPDGRTLASCGIDQTILLWDVPARRLLRKLEGAHTFWVNSVVFHPDGQMLASGGEDGRVILWDVATGKPLFEPLQGHSAGVHQVVFSADGEILASCSGRVSPPTEDNSIILWDVQTGQAIGRPLRGHSSSVSNIEFSPDGRMLVSSSLDGAILLWDVDLQSWQARACAIANRNLTLREWQQFLRDEPCRPICAHLTDLCAASAAVP